MQIIVRNKKSEGERRNAEAASSARKHYYHREIKQGSRFVSKAGSKEQIKKALDESN